MIHNASIQTFWNIYITLYALKYIRQYLTDSTFYIVPLKKYLNQYLQ